MAGFAGVSPYNALMKSQPNPPAGGPTGPGTGNPLARMQSGMAGVGGLASGAPIVTNTSTPGALPGPANSSIPNTFTDAGGRLWEYGQAGDGGKDTWSRLVEPTTPYGALVSAGRGPSAAATPAAAGPQSPFTLDWFNGMFERLTQPKPQAPAQVAPPQRPDTTQAYASTKDTIGRSTAAAQKQLLEQLVAAGQDPESPFVQAQLANVASGGTRALGDAAQEIEKANERWGNTAYQGGIAQRSQDIGLQEADLSRRWGLLPSMLALLRTNPIY